MKGIRMTPNAVRLECPDCRFSVVVTEELVKSGALPEGVRKKIYDSFVCPNHPTDTLLAPIASVETRTSTPMPGKTATIEEWKRKLQELEQRCEQAEAEATALVDQLKEAKAKYKAATVTLRTALRRFLAGGEIGESRGPLLEQIDREDEDEDNDGHAHELSDGQCPVCDARASLAYHALAGRLVCSECGWQNSTPGNEEAALDDARRLLAERLGTPPDDHEDEPPRPAEPEPQPDVAADEGHHYPTRKRRARRRTH